MADSEKKFVVVTGRIPVDIHTQAERQMAGKVDSFQSLVKNAIESFAKTGQDPTRVSARTSTQRSETAPERDMTKLGTRQLSKEESKLAETLLNWWNTPATSSIQKLVKQSLADILHLRDRLPKGDR